MQLQNKYIQILAIKNVLI